MNFFYERWISLFHSSFQFCEKISLPNSQEKNQLRKNWFDTSNNVSILHFWLIRYVPRRIDTQNDSDTSFRVVCLTVLMKLLKYANTEMACARQTHSPDTNLNEWFYFILALCRNINCIYTWDQTIYLFLL